MRPIASKTARVLTVFAGLMCVVLVLASSRTRIGAICADGTRSSATGSGACSHHGGVASWIYAEEEPAPVTPTPSPAEVAPSAPSTLTATATSTSQITLSWHDNSGDEMGFVIERKLSAGDYNPIAVVGANVTTYSDKLLSAATMYCYRVRAYNTAGDSSDSNESCATTTVGADNAPPSLTTPPLSPADELATRLASVELHTDDLKREIQRLAVLVEVLETSLSSVQKLDTRLTGISADIDIVEQKVEALDRRVQTAEVVVQAQKVSSNAWLTVSVVLAGLAMLVALTTWLLAVGH